MWSIPAMPNTITFVKGENMVATCTVSKMRVLSCPDEDGTGWQEIGTNDRNVYAGDGVSSLPIAGGIPSSHSPEKPFCL